MEHGEVSKGLPSRLKYAKAGSLDKLPNSFETNAMIHRKNAHGAGTRARHTGDERAANQSRYYGLRSKNMYKESLADAQRAKLPLGGKKKKRVLP